MKSHSQILKFKIQKLRNEISLSDFEIQNQVLNFQNAILAAQTGKNFNFNFENESLPDTFNF